MKKALLPILVIIIAVLVMIPMFNASAENQKLRGDADGDGVISITDVSTIQLLIAEMGEIEQENLAAADVDGNGVIEIDDASAIQIYLAEYEDPYLIGYPIASQDTTSQTSTTKSYELPFVPF